jgi:hypothetical protein
VDIDAQVSMNVDALLSWLNQLKNHSHSKTAWVVAIEEQLFC